MPNGRAIADRMITYFGDHQQGFGRGIEIAQDQFGQVGVETAGDLCTALLDLHTGGLLDFPAGANKPHALAQLGIGHSQRMVLTLQGWDRFEHLKRTNPNSTTAFMAMKFGDAQMDRIYQDHFRLAVRDIGYQLQTVQPNAGPIDYRIRLEITASRFVIADLTHSNLGAYFEAGYAEGIGRPVIYTCRRDAFQGTEAGKPHFDINHHYCVRWDDPPTPEQIEELKVVIRNALLNQ